MRQIHLGFFVAAMALLSGSATAQKQYDPGATDKEIKIGHTGPYSGPASAFGAIGKSIGAYFDKVNAEEGVNGRMIKFVSLDDGYNPAKTVENARRLVEQEEVLLLLNPLGSAHNTAIHKYMNDKHVPQLFIGSALAKWGDPKNFPWTMGFAPPFAAETQNFASHLLETKPNAKIGILYQADDFGKDYVKGLEEGLGDKAKTMIVSKQSYEVTDPTIDSQMISLQSSGADTFFNFTSPKQAAQAIKKAAELGWKPTHYLVSSSVSVAAVMTPAGLDNGIGVISAYYVKDPTDAQFQQGKEWDDYQGWMKKYYPGGNLTDSINVYGYCVAQTMVQVLKQAGDNLTRANIMRQAANLDMTLPMLLPGVNVKTAPDDFYPVERERLARFNGKSWELFGKVYGR